jgi:hypothetical protein
MIYEGQIIIDLFGRNIEDIKEEDISLHNLNIFWTKSRETHLFV